MGISAHSIETKHGMRIPPWPITADTALLIRWIAHHDPQSGKPRHIQARTN